MALEPVTALLDFGGKLIDKLFPDPTKKAEALLKLRELEQSGDLQVIASQVEINKLEAQNSNLFVSGWRPAVGWLCATALGVQIVVGPLLVWGNLVFGRALALPHLDTELLTTLLIGMLGLGGLRTVEKLQGVASK